MEASLHIKRLMRRAQRRVAQRIARCYRTTSFAAATVLAGIPPLELLAKRYAKVYWRVRELREAHNNHVPHRAIREVKLHARQQMINEWSEWLAQEAQWANPRTARVIAAIQPRLIEWIGRGRGGIPFRTAQILTGHGSLGEFLRWIGRDRTAECLHCDAPEDTAQNTLEECPEWREERRALVAVVGRDLSLPAIINAWIRNERSRRAVVLFCEAVISQKEDHERARRGENGGARGRGRQGGGTRGRPARRRYRPPKPGAHTRPI